MSPVVWPILLLLLGVLLIFLEIFVPSGGILGFLSLVAVVAAVIMAFVNNDLATGTVFLALTAIVIPAAVTVAVRWWPNTPLGRLILIRPPRSDDEILPDHDEFESLLGKRGNAKSDMLPSGAITIEGRTYNAVTQGMAIEAGQTIEVIAVRGNRIVVRLADGPPAAGQEDQDDVLSRPIDTVGLDPFDDPLA
jgi:membrane-bound ClpP family serine protease